MLYKVTRCIFVIIMSCMLLLTGCTKEEIPKAEIEPKDTPIAQLHPEDESLLRLLDNMNNEKKLMAVAYLGWVDGGFSEIMDYMQEKSYVEDYPFLGSIDEGHFVKNDGSEIYAVVPCDKDTELKVYKYEFDTQGTLFTTDELFSETEGNPILIQGNISEIAPNIMLKAIKGDSVTEFAPSLSGMDGKLANSENKVLDFSLYSRMEWFEENEEMPNSDFFGDWCGFVQDSGGNDLSLMLSFDENNTAVYSYGLMDSDVSESFRGEWKIDKNTGLLRLAMYGGPIGRPEEYYMKELSMSWSTSEGNLLVTHKSGMPLISNQIGKRYVFCPAY